MSHPKYKLRVNDTVDRLTLIFEVEETIWKQYHNNKCRLDDVIYENKIPKHLKEIYLLPELWNKEEQLNTSLSLIKNEISKISFNYDNTFPMKLCSDPLYYGIVLYLFNENKINTIKYEVCIKWINKKDNKYIIEVNRKPNLYINDKEPDLVADELATKIGAILYPLELVVTRKDGIIGINNFNEIQKRWITVKQKIRDYYEGETTEKYLTLNETIIMSTDSKALLQSLKNDWFLHGFFNSIYQTYGSLYNINHTIETPLKLGLQKLEFEVNQSISPTIDERGMIIVKMQGHPYPIKGNYEAYYMINGSNHSIESFTIDANIDATKHKKISMIVSKIKKQ